MTSGEPQSYVGRFAPSPSGPLHFGSLLAAVASYLQARTQAGRWLLRIEDIDPPREQPGADRLIIETLRAFGFEWDGPVRYQSESKSRHEELTAQLLERGLAFPCSCSRRQLANAADGDLGKIYPGTCRAGCISSDVAIRVRTDNQPIRFIDGLQGEITQHLESESGDFIIRRRDGLIAYHLAVVADDADQQVTEIVRGIDLLDSTPRQIYLQRLLGFVTPSYLHIPVAINPVGQKLSKLTGAPAIDNARPEALLVAALNALRQPIEPQMVDWSLSSIWKWALTHWDTGPLRGLAQVNGFDDALAED